MGSRFSLAMKSLGEAVPEPVSHRLRSPASESCLPTPSSPQS